jgi:hypothetical protein
VGDDPDVVLTDGHDLEMMLIRSQALDRILRECPDAGCISRFSQSVGVLRERLVQAVAALGWIRWLSQRHALSLKISGIDYFNLVDRKALTISVTAACESVRSRQGGTSGAVSVPVDLEELILRQMAGNHDLWQVCCGHDVTGVLATLLQGRGSQEYKAERLESLLRLAFESRDFEESAMRKQILTWQARNPPFRLL